MNLLLLIAVLGFMAVMLVIIVVLALSLRRK